MEPNLYDVYHNKERIAQIDEQGKFRLFNLGRFFNCIQYDNLARLLENENKNYVALEERLYFHILAMGFDESTTFNLNERLLHRGMKIAAFDPLVKGLYDLAEEMGPFIEQTPEFIMPSRTLGKIAIDTENKKVIIQERFIYKLALIYVEPLEDYEKLGVFEDFVNTL